MIKNVDKLSDSLELINIHSFCHISTYNKRRQCTQYIIYHIVCYNTQITLTTIYMSKKCIIFLIKVLFGIWFSVLCQLNVHIYIISVLFGIELFVYCQVNVDFFLIAVLLRRHFCVSSQVKVDFFLIKVLLGIAFCVSSQVMVDFFLNTVLFCIQNFAS